MQLKRVYLYDDPEMDGLDTEALGRYLRARLPQVAVEVRGEFFTHQLRRVAEEDQGTAARELAKQLRRAQVKDLVHPAERRASGREDPAELGLGPVYRAAALQAIMSVLLHSSEAGLDHLHIVLAGQAIGDWDETRQFRLRVACLGQPSIVSTVGLVEVPRRPRQYSFMRAHLVALGLEEDLDDLAEAFGRQALGYGDPRINDVLKGYALMAVFYRLYGEGPCADRTCRLYDAATQEELLACQCGPRTRLCRRHSEMLAAAGGRPE
ncbi:MAG: hypothetical protein N2512_00340 [Armatimonadetes bacterium]|nr:hypothetical protein [Armatimonadota bacterium]